MINAYIKLMRLLALSALDAPEPAPKARAHFMRRISMLYRELDEDTESLTWLKKVSVVLETSGDIFALANCQILVAEIQRAEGRLDEVIASYRRVLTLIGGRSFNYLSAGTRISLAGVLVHRRDFQEAEEMLRQAEVLCRKHKFKGLLSDVAQLRSAIETEVKSGQAPSHTLSELLDSLNQLLKYRPDQSQSYLPFWLFAWKTELLALVRSGPNVSFMVISDDVERFLGFSAKFTNLADHFLMSTSDAPTISVDHGILPIPPTWKFPASFPFLMTRKMAKGSRKGKDARQQITDYVPPKMNLTGPAQMLPAYMMVDTKSDVKGEGHMMALGDPKLPKGGIELMLGVPMEKLVQHRAVWFPTQRFESKDPFLTDLLVSRERGVFPVYFDRIPTSDAVMACGAVQINFPATMLDGSDVGLTTKWKRALLKLAKLKVKEEAEAALLELPDIFSGDHLNGGDVIEMHLFEFTGGKDRVSQPVFLLRESHRNTEAVS
jgi:hypothetical protein